jgi:hypothetical protein
VPRSGAKVPLGATGAATGYALGVRQVERSSLRAFELALEWHVNTL